MKFNGIIIAAAIALAGCSETAVQQMSRDTFKVDTRTDFDCGATETRNIAFRVAAVEVIQRGGDKFIIVGDETDTDFWLGTRTQGLVVRMIPENAPEARNALSARAALGPNWQEVVGQGTPDICI